MHEEVTRVRTSGEATAESQHPASRPLRAPWSRADQLTLFFIVVTFLAFVGSTVVAIVDQNDANQMSQNIQHEAVANAKSVAQEAGISTAKVYLTELRVIQNGVATTVVDDRYIQPYAPITSLDPSVADSVAMLEAGANPQTVADLDNLIGQLKIAYSQFGSRSVHARYWGCSALHYGLAAFDDLEGIPGIGQFQLATAPSARGICQQWHLTT